jgi:hypothetical protein
MPSEKTRCPECQRKIDLESVPLTAFFKCPFCSEEICVTSQYRAIQTWVAAIVAVIVPYLFGAGWWTILLWWPAFMFFVALEAYVLKYVFHPTLVNYVPLAGHGRITLGLSEKHDPD